MSYNQLLRQNTKTQNRTDIAIFRDNLKKNIEKNIDQNTQSEYAYTPSTYFITARNQ